MRMGNWGRNGEGYADSTAGIAIGRVSKEERKKSMAKKRSCRRTADENIIHEKAVKMRKMTDEQLVSYVEGRVEKERIQPQLSAAEFVEEIGRIKGIGAATMCKIRELLDKRLEGDMDG